MARLNGKTALITGGASGLGAAIVERFVAEGATVIIADIDTANGEALAETLGTSARYQHLDVTSETSWQAAIDAVAAQHGRLDILVNNAGITTVGSIEDLSLADFRAMLDIDLVGVFLGCKLALPLMKATGGSIVNMASMCSLRAQEWLVGYNAAKAGVGHLTKSVALHCAKSGYGIRCNSIHPGVIHTPILDKVLSQVADADAMYAGWVAIHPVGRLGKPEEIAAVALYLASDESQFTTGGEFVVDGGSSL